MSARLVNRRHNHRSPGAAFDYQIREQEQLGFGSSVAVYRGDGTFVGHFTKKQFVAMCNGVGPNGEKLRRTHPRASQGELLCLSVPATVAGAMKLTGLTDNPRRTFRVLTAGLGPAMQELNAHAYGRTTGGKLVKGDCYYAVFPGYSNRAGELALQLSVWLFPTVRAADRRSYALHNAPLYRAQKKIQALWHMGVARALRAETGVMCGPKGNSFTAFGVKTGTRRQKSMRAHLRGTSYRGAAARGEAARRTRGPKRTTTWAEAVESLAATAAGKVRRAVRDWSEYREAAFARKCVARAFWYCNRTAARFNRTDVFATAAHLALPHVRPEVFSREFEALAARPERYGVAVARTYPDGNVMYAPLSAEKAEARAGRALWALGTRPGGLSRDRVARALAGSGCTTGQYDRVQALADGRVTLAPNALDDPSTLRTLARAFSGNRREVHAVGRAAGEALGVPADSALGFAESLVRTPHLRALWRGLRTPGSLSHKLAVAEYIRAHGHTRLRRGSLVVVSAADTRDAASLTRIVEVVRKARGKLVVTGPGAQDYAALAQQHAATATLRRKAGAHL